MPRHPDSVVSPKRLAELEARRERERDRLEALNRDGASPERDAKASAQARESGRIAWNPRRPV
jgi:hypothetical protein